MLPINFDILYGIYIYCDLISSVRDNSGKTVERFPPIDTILTRIGKIMSDLRKILTTAQFIKWLSKSFPVNTWKSIGCDIRVY